MTFSIQAVGTADEVRKQLAAIDMTHSGDLGQTVRSFLAHEVLEGVSGSEMPDHKAMFIIEANGHGDAHNVSLNISVRPIWVPREQEVDA
jgi:hypothetical protein